MFREYDDPYTLNQIIERKFTLLIYFKLKKVIENIVVYLLDKLFSYITSFWT